MRLKTSAHLAVREGAILFNLKKWRIMELQLKRVKIYEELSDETICFAAELYSDGKKVAVARNDGRGGSTDVIFTEGCRSETAQRHNDSSSMPMITR